MSRNLPKMNANIRSVCLLVSACLPLPLVRLPFCHITINRHVFKHPCICSINRIASAILEPLASTVHIPSANNQHFCKLNLPIGSRKISRTFLHHFHVSIRRLSFSTFPDHSSLAHSRQNGAFCTVHMLPWRCCNRTHAASSSSWSLMVCLCSMNFPRVSTVSPYARA